MFTFKLQDGSLEKIVTKYRVSIKDNVDTALNRIWTSWGAELERQRRSGGDGQWKALDPNYARQKEKEYPRRGFLDRTGFMMRGYLNGISIDPTSYTVTIPFPTGTDKFGREVNIRAKGHQHGAVHLPKRPFDLEKLEAIAVKHFKEAIERSLNV